MDPTLPGGVDGCAGGWLVATHGQAMELCRTFSELLEAHPGRSLYVDIPMGLPDLFARDLESQARKLLPGRSGSLFPVPCRSAVYERSYVDACEKNLKRIGKKISKQTWNICPKIREVDLILGNNHSLQQRVFESHPELSFALLAQRPLKYSKKTAEGISERLELLSDRYPEAQACYKHALERYPRKLVARDDILDAMVLLVVGMVDRTVLSDSSRQDERGLQIRMMLPKTG